MYCCVLVPFISVCAISSCGNWDISEKTAAPEPFIIGFATTSQRNCLSRIELLKFKEQNNKHEMAIHWNVEKSSWPHLTRYVPRRSLYKFIVEARTIVLPQNDWPVNIVDRPAHIYIDWERDVHANSCVTDDDILVRFSTLHSSHSCRLIVQWSRAALVHFYTLASTTAVHLIWHESIELSWHEIIRRVCSWTRLSHHHLECVIIQFHGHTQTIRVTMWTVKRHVSRWMVPTFSAHRMNWKSWNMGTWHQIGEMNINCRMKNCAHSLPKLKRSSTHDHWAPSVATDRFEFIDSEIRLSNLSTRNNWDRTWIHWILIHGDQHVW